MADRANYPDREPDYSLLDERIKRALVKRDEERPIANGGGGGHDSGMEQRVIRLEEWARQSEQRMERVEAKLDRIGDVLGRVESSVAGMATKRDLANYTLSGLGLGLALMALIIGSIIGGLSWIKPDPQVPTPPPPVTITAPPPQIIYMQPPAVTPPPAPPQQ